MPRGGLIRAVVLVAQGKIRNRLSSGNLFCSPVTALEEVEEALQGINLQKEMILERIQSIYQKPNYQFTGTTPEDLLKLVWEAAEKAV